MNALARLHELNAELEAVMLAMKIGGGWEVERGASVPGRTERPLMFTKPNAAYLIATRKSPKDKYIDWLHTTRDKNGVQALKQIRSAIASRADKRGQTITTHAQPSGEGVTKQNLTRLYQMAGFKRQRPDGLNKGVPMIRRPNV